ncbi:hypothetical protein D3878_22360 [Noviherbaspirillum sedimenti]|uniref:Uncharacterized protein n=1 Tax=Noviherbaspirillum sedimenti TaxID=2320865 RepID=A0A3A3GBE8_9BURK|nr:hypothetical protein D3878_22360 [Noviherbaspirillum sedimenti]
MKPPMRRTQKLSQNDRYDSRGKHPKVQLNNITTLRRLHLVALYFEFSYICLIDIPRNTFKITGNERQWPPP